MFKIIFPEITQGWTSVARGITFDRDIPSLLLSFFSLDRSEENWVASPDLGQLVRFWNSFSLLVDAFLFALDEARDLCSNASRPWVIFPEYRPVVYRFKQICQPREKEEDLIFSSSFKLLTGLKSFLDPFLWI